MPPRDCGLLRVWAVCRGLGGSTKSSKARESIPEQFQAQKFWFSSQT